MTSHYCATAWSEISSQPAEKKFGSDYQFDCKKIRNDQNYWQRVEGYISDHTDVEFSHGIRPDCHGRVMAELAQRRNEKDGKIELD